MALIGVQTRTQEMMEVVRGSAGGGIGSGKKKHYEIDP